MAPYVDDVLPHQLWSSFGVKCIMTLRPTPRDEPVMPAVFKEAPFKPTASATRYSAAVLGFRRSTEWPIVDRIRRG